MTYVSAVSNRLARIDAPQVRRIGIGDLRAALIAGVQDFVAVPTQLVFLGILYPIIGLVAVLSAKDETLLPLLLPLVAGVTLMGPLLAVGIYELSRRHEAKLPVTWLNAFDVLRSASIHGIALLGILLLGLFVAWLISARVIYDVTVGMVPLTSLGELINHVQTSPAAWYLVSIGTAVGVLFATVVLALTAVSFPMMLDRNVSPMVAARTSVRVVVANPRTMVAWGVMIATILGFACIPLFLGLAVALPVLGHATWHLYRRAVA